MSNQSEFHFWLNQLLLQNNIDTEKKELFSFLSFNESENSNKSDDSIFTVYEDWWIRKPEIVRSKIKSLLKITNNRIYARQCSVEKVNKTAADEFINFNHILGPVNSKVRLALVSDESLFAIAAFAGQRQFKTGRSVELLRFCVKSDYSVIGGLDKLLQFYIKSYKPDSIMTYIDKDWGRGDSFLNLGFKSTAIKKPIEFYVHKKTAFRISKKRFNDFRNINNYYKIKNKGSIKLIKEISY